MKILVTGGSGFIGSHIVDNYIQDGHEVIIVDNLSLSTNEFINKQAKTYFVDLMDVKKIINIFKIEKPEVVNHHAADSRLRRSFTEIKTASDNNIGGTLSIIEAARRYPPKKIIFASSGGAIYSDSQLQHKENEHCVPISPYGIGKLTCEQLFFFCQQYYGIPYVALRYGNVYGPRQNGRFGNGIISILINNALHNRKTKLIGDGSIIRDFVYIDDVVSANLIALYSLFTGAINIATSKGTSITDISKSITRFSNKSCAFVYVPAYQYGEQTKCVLDVHLAKRAINWSPRISIETGISKTINWHHSRIGIE